MWIVKPRFILATFDFILLLGLTIGNLIKLAKHSKLVMDINSQTEKDS